MTPQIQEWVKSISHHLSGPTLEVGCMDINGGIRQFLPQPYTGIDTMPGKGVDMMLDGHKALLHFGPVKFGVVACCECIEHDKDPWSLVCDIREMIVPGGHLVLTSPTFGFPLHRHPRDYYRFGMDAYEDVFFEDMDVINLREVRDFQGNPCIVGIAKKRAGV